MSDREQERAAMREAMPNVASVVDMFRAAGIEVRVRAAIEGGLEVGNRRLLDEMRASAEVKCDRVEIIGGL